MATTALGKIREADTPPVACSSCFGQYVERRHVDFSAAYDGPVLNGDEVIQNGVTPIQIDDLIICEECLATAADVLGYSPEHAEALAALRAEVEDLKERNRGLELHNRNLSAAVASKPEAKPKAAAAKR